eukprot:scaffold1691_cov378-Prasinococcus_capsulatus_cf.AAC.2
MLTVVGGLTGCAEAGRGARAARVPRGGSHCAALAHLRLAAAPVGVYLAARRRGPPARVSLHPLPAGTSTRQRAPPSSHAPPLLMEQACVLDAMHERRSVTGAPMCVPGPVQGGSRIGPTAGNPSQRGGGGQCCPRWCQGRGHVTGAYLPRHQAGIAQRQRRRTAAAF